MFKKFLNNFLSGAIGASFIVIGLSLFYIALVKFGMSNFYIFCSFSALLSFVAAIFVERLTINGFTLACLRVLVGLSILFICLIFIRPICHIVPHV